MRIFIDVGHPAHVHYFRNFITIMREKGHDFVITAREKDCAVELLQAYGLEFQSRGPGRKSLAGKLLYIARADWQLYRLARKFQPDLFLSFGSSYAAHAAWLTRKPHIAFDDTEHAALEHLLYVPFTQVICTPQTFLKDFGEKQIRFNSNMELCYLHPKYFQPDPEVLEQVGITEGEKYVILRSVSWTSSHDRGHTGFNLLDNRRAVADLGEHTRVFITSEHPLPADLEPYRIKIPPHLIHHVLAQATLYIGDGGTMAAESALLGTPAIYVSTLARLIGVFHDLQEHGLMHLIASPDAAIGKAIKMVRDGRTKGEAQRQRDMLLSTRLDVTQFMVWLVENYPDSVKTARQEKFLNEAFAFATKVNIVDETKQPDSRENIESTNNY